MTKDPTPVPLLRVRRLLAAGMLLLTLAACSGSRPEPEDPAEPTFDSEAWVEATMEAMTLSERVSQLFAVPAYGTYSDATDERYLELAELVETFGAGGVIFFQGDPFGQAVLADDLQRLAKVPLLMSQDAEWGVGMRVDGTTVLPRTMALGATRDTALAYAAGVVTAREARALGVRQVYAPVVDVNNNPRNPIINVRAFGEEPDLVSQMAAAFVRGVQGQGVLSTLKHFPGHGDTATDSHSDLPVLDLSLARLDSLELAPFRSLADDAASVMVGHLALPQIDPEPNVPATLSTPVVSGLLRERLGFDGLVVTDALNMSGVTKHFSPGEIAVRALEAGVDLLLMSTDPYAAREAILGAVREGRLTSERIDHSVRRLLVTKATLGLVGPPTQESLVDQLAHVRSVVANPAHQALARTIAYGSLTLLRNEGGLLPLLADSLHLTQITLNDGADPQAGTAFAAMLRAAGHAGPLDVHLVDRRTSAEEREAALEAAAAADVVLVPAFLYVRAWSGTIGLMDAQKAFVEQLTATGTPVVLIAFGNPYIITGIEPPAAYVAAYSASEASQAAVADALFGKAPFVGRLPVVLSNHHGVGDGLVVEAVRPRQGLPEEVGMRSALRWEARTLLRAAIADSAFPGAALAVGRAGVTVLQEGYGTYTYEDRTPVHVDTRYDLASLTKVVATTTAAMKLYEAGRLDLDAPVARYLPSFGQNGKGAITVRQLLTHTSGLIPFRPFHTMGVTSRDSLLARVLAEEPVTPPGTEMQYSDFNMIVLMLAIEAITSEPFATWTDREVFRPLGMRNTGFIPSSAPDLRAVPTEVDTLFRGRLVQGEVHDETAWILGGVSGHAGLFSTAADLALFGHMLANEGRVDGRAFLRPETVRLFTTAVAPEQHSRALGWDTKSPEGYSSAGALFGPRSFGHTGFTGTSLWIDPDEDLFVVLLTNRVYPTRDNRKHVPIRPAVADLAASSVAGPPTPLTFIFEGTVARP